MFISTFSYAGNLTVNVEDARNQNGDFYYALFNDDEGFPDDVTKSFRQGKVSAKEVTFTLDDLPPGVYALTFFHDENGNGKMDKTLGIPLEGFAFSNNPRILFGPPSFKKCSFKMDEDKTITLTVKKL